MFLEVVILLNSREEQTVILNDITQDKDKVLGDNSNETVKFHRLNRSMEEAISTFQSEVEAEQQNGAPQQKQHLGETENLSRR